MQIQLRASVSFKITFINYKLGKMCKKTGEISRLVPLVCNTNKNLDIF